jgi:hypothetical protein
MKNNTLFEKITLFLVCISLPLLFIALILDMYFNFKVHEFIRFHSDDYVLHDYCYNFYNKFYCVDDYFVP